MTYTALRTYKGSKATVTLYKDGVEISKAGGNRAARAAAVLVAAWDDEEPGIYGLRGDFATAATEAHRVGTATTARYHGKVLARRPASFSVAVPVTEG